MKIGFIGLGIMGSRMAGHLLAAEHELIVHNRTKQKAQPLIESGARWAESPAEAARDADVVITMLAHPQAVEQTALDDTGFLAAMREGALWVDCSTVNPSFSRRMAAVAAQHTIRFLDAPVAGSKTQAAHAELVFFVGGDTGAIPIAQPLFDLMGKNTVHVGAHGMGTSLKIVVNMLLATAMVTFAEGMALGESLGLSREMLFNVLIGGPVVAPFVAGKRAKMESGDYDPEFPLRWMQKDLHLAAQTAYETGAALPIANLSKELYQMAARQGLAESDFSAIYDYMCRDTG